MKDYGQGCLLISNTIVNDLTLSHKALRKTSKDKCSYSPCSEDYTLRLRSPK